MTRNPAWAQFSSWVADVQGAAGLAGAALAHWAQRERFPRIPGDAEVRRRLAAPSYKLRVPSSIAPVVSIVIPVYGKFATTFWCLDSLAKTRCEIPYEVIVVNDASPDETLSMLGQVEGIRTISNAQNSGFIRSCNVGGRAALGKYVCFLNNDTRVTDGWLDALIGTFDTFPRAGLVGGKLLFPDGRLQEAGGTVFRTGACSHYGRNRDPNRSEYSYVRPVDYCSGACLALRTELFHLLEGFDPRYLPAYFEDTDLAFRVRERGLEVLYQPLCRVAHYEGVTHGKNPTQGLKRHQTLNQATFHERWRTELRDHPVPGNRTWSAGERRLASGLVAISPSGIPPVDATFAKTLLLARAAGLRVCLMTSAEAQSAALSQWQGLGVEVVVAHSLEAALSRLSRSWVARYRHAVFDGVVMMARFSEMIRARAPQLRHWLVERATEATGSGEFANWSERADGVIASTPLAGTECKQPPRDAEEARELFAERESSQLASVEFNK